MTGVKLDGHSTHVTLIEENVRLRDLIRRMHKATDELLEAELSTDMTWRQQNAWQKAVSNTRMLIREARKINGEQRFDSKETHFDRQAGFPCRRCGTMATPQFLGNTLIGYYCQTCDEEIES